LKNNFNAKMAYMENNFDKRLNPALLVDNAKSVISLVINYFPPIIQTPELPQISKYAYNADYHLVFKEKANTLLKFIEMLCGEVQARIFVDSAPVLERAWAKLSGLGWIGKNSNFVCKPYGSYVFLGQIIIDAEFAYDQPSNHDCRQCRLCIEACPTKAIVEPYVVNSNLCIAYQTIENKDDIPDFLLNKFPFALFGCDICQDVCPHNRKPLAGTITEFSAKPEILTYKLDNWLKLNEDEFNLLFRNSPLKRLKFKNFMRNVNFLQKKLSRRL